VKGIIVREDIVEDESNINEEVIIGAEEDNNNEGFKFGS